MRGVLGEHAPKVSLPEGQHPGRWLRCETVNTKCSAKQFARGPRGGILAILDNRVRQHRAEGGRELSGAMTEEERGQPLAGPPRCRAPRSRCPCTSLRLWLVCGIATIVAAVLADRSRAAMYVGRGAVGMLFIVGGALLHLLNLASGA